MRVGVLALQGDVREHCNALKHLKVFPVEVRTVKELDSVDGLIIPGGESTTIMKLISRCGLDKAIKKRVKEGMPVYGTCAGAILLGKVFNGENNQGSLGVIDIDVVRNYYGRQLDSFETYVSVKNLGKVNGVFIRAPVIKRVGKDVEILAQHKQEVVLVKSGKILVSTFHPELTADLKVHRYFLSFF